MGKTLHISVVDKIATYRARDGYIVCGNKGYQVKFTFDPEWNGYPVKTARFVYKDSQTDVVLTGDTCDVPMMRGVKLLEVGVFAGDLATTTPALIPCLESIRCRGGAPAAPSPDVYDQIMELLNGGTQSTEEDDNIPEYWKPALENGAEAINTALCAAGRNKSAFLFYSDAHWNYGSQMAPRLLKYLYRHTGMAKTFFGGDIVNDEENDYDVMAYLWDWRKQIKDLPNHHSVVGNHDDGNSTPNLFSPEYVYGYLLAPEETPDMVMGDGLYYYIDNNAEKTRYICLDTGFQTGSTDQTAMRSFLTETLKSTQSGWHIVVVSHIWYGPDYDRYSERPIPIAGMSTEAAAVCTVLDNYNARSGEFANGGAKVEFCIGGHVHRDYVDSTDGGIPIILVETDSMHLRGTYTYRAGTTTESSVNGIVANYNTNTLHIIRVGRGDSFNVDLSNADVSTSYSVTNNLTNVASSSTVSSVDEGKAYTATLTATSGTIKSVVVTMGGTDITSTAYNANTGVISISAVTGAIVITAVAQADTPGGNYTNVLSSALAADGKSVYNGVGYKNDTRWSQSGQTESASTGTHLTGWISVSDGDIVRLANMTTQSSNFTLLFSTACGSTSGSNNHANVLNTMSGATDESGNLVQFTMAGGYSFIRIVCGGIDSTSIITINEEIAEGAYTNLFVKSESHDDYRLNSSGVLTESSGDLVTGFIPVQPNTSYTIRTRNLTDSESGVIGRLSEYSAANESNHVVQYRCSELADRYWEGNVFCFPFTTSATTNFIRLNIISGKGCDFIITLNEPIPIE